MGLFTVHVILMTIVTVMLIKFPVDGLFPNGSVSVFNAERLKTPDGEANVIYGYAYRADPKDEGKFTVKLQGVLFPAPCKLL